MAKVFLLHGSQEFNGTAKRAAERFLAMTGVKVDITSGSLTKVADMIEGGFFSVIFVEKNLVPEDANYLGTCIPKDQESLFIILKKQSSQSLENYIAKSQLLSLDDDFSEDFVFSVFRNLLLPPNQKLDLRYMKSILTSVIQVIEQNSQTELTPDTIEEIKPNEKHEDLVSVLGFYGDGFLGSVTVSCATPIINQIAQNMLFMDPKDLDQETLLDLYAEVSNQILGVIRSELREFGYSLKNSMQLVSNGNEVMHRSVSNGRYYRISFTLGEDKLVLTLCYNTYRTSLKELVKQKSESGKNIMDIRMLEKCEDAMIEVVKANFYAEKVGKIRISNQPTSGIPTESLHVFHGGGWQGEFSLGIDLSVHAAGMLLQKMMGMDPEMVSESEVNDALSEITNQIGGEFLKKTKELGYNFERIYHGAFTTKSNMQYVLKNPGYGIRIEFLVDDIPIVILFGVRSGFASAYMDAWSMLKTTKNFEHGITSLKKGGK